jgi:hypothetical protein
MSEVVDRDTQPTGTEDTEPKLLAFDRSLGLKGEYFRKFSIRSMPSTLTVTEFDQLEVTFILWVATASDSL